MIDLLPVLDLGSSGALIAEAFGGRGQYERGFLHHWNTATKPDRPAIIFVPGFLSEGDPQQPGWRRQMVAVAGRHDLASYVLHWPSGLGPESPLKVLVEQLDALSSTSAGVGLAAVAAVGPPGLALVGIPIAQLAYDVAAKAWKDAVGFADVVGSAPEHWTQALNRPVILVGHSLGGRIVLRAAESGRVNSLESVIALAPAVRLKDLTLKRVVENSIRPPEVYWSRSDLVLEFLFRIGEITSTHALGFTGPSARSGLSSFDTSVYADTVTAHGSYQEIAAELLRESPTFGSVVAGPRVMRKLGNTRPEGAERSSCCPKASNGTRSVWRCGCGYRWCEDCLSKQNVAVGETAFGRLAFSDYTCRYCDRTITAKQRVVTVLAGMKFGNG